jgi:hypothetical protein
MEATVRVQPCFGLSPGVGLVEDLERRLGAGVVIAIDHAGLARVAAVAIALSGEGNRWRR